MVKNRFLILLLLTTAFLSHIVHADGTDHSHMSSHMKLTGVISEVRSGVIFIETPGGQFTVNSTMGLGASDIGQEVTLTIDENNMAIDVHKKDDRSIQKHRFITGEIVSQDGDTMTVQTSGGEKRLFLAQSARSLRRSERGSVVTAKINEAGEIIDLHPLHVHLALVQRPRIQPDLHMKFSGTVTDIRSGVVFLRTTFGIATLNYASRRRDIHVGDRLTVWVNEVDYVMDVHGHNGGGYHRIITGKAAYADEDHKTLRVWTHEGVTIYPIREGTDKFNPLSAETPVTVEINESGQVIDVHQDQ